MDGKLKFTEKDKDQIIEFLNMVANNAEFTMKTPQLIKYYHLLAYMQREVLPKVEANIFEIKQVINPPANEG